MEKCPAYNLEFSDKFWDLPRHEQCKFVTVMGKYKNDSCTCCNFWKEYRPEDWDIHFTLRQCKKHRIPECKTE